MPKAGRYDYPANDLEYCIEKLRKIIEVCKADTIKREVAADALGMAIRGGATSSLFASMAIYGLVETHEGELRITELGKSIIFGEPDEVERAKGESVRKVAL
ncbi:MAG: hypothetical protein H3Z52_06855, partial [archaeon]|nr:hypothetical protein [archaeon]MCP8320643.1 hypothetical protein [archaeon]